MDSHLIREYRERYQAVANVELAEQRAASVSSRWQQLNSLLEIALALGLRVNEADKEEMDVWIRWARLKGAQI